MAKSKIEKSCFIIMPITTPEQLVERYKGDVDHFDHVLGHLFKPALKEAGFNPISPKSTGSDVIQAEIIKQLSSCELVLCDMSILNPNVFFEFGIRTALNKPVALVIDDETKNIPFDTSIINFHKYGSSLDAWSIAKEKQALAKHVQEAYQKTKDYNALWKYFGVAQTGMFKPEDAEMGEKLDLIMQELSAIKVGQKELEMSRRMYQVMPSDWLPTHHGIFQSGHEHATEPLFPYSNVSSIVKSDEEMLQERIDLLQQNLKLLRANTLKATKKDKSQESDSAGGS